MYHKTLVHNLFSKEIEQLPTRNGYGEGMVLAGKKNKDVVVLCCDLTESTRSQAFKDAFPDRFIEMGVAEQNMAGVAAGLALEGKIPFCSSYAVFNPGRNWDQIRVSVCYNNANVKIAGAHAGISVGPDGATHQALEDIAITRVLPNMTVIAPCDAIETRKATMAAAALEGPVYLRFTREKTPVFTTDKTPFTIGKAEVLKQGRDVTVIACGPLVYEALLAAKKIDKTAEVEVINCHTIKPIDIKTIVASVRKTGAVVTVEEHQVQGGLGSAVAEVLAQHMPVPMEMVGMHDTFGESGEPTQLLKKYGMTADDIIRAIKTVIRRAS
ncbi:MAG TPA: transketolase family protein [Candidatus Kapabacteria bacterium]|nr:transketolase family protein [Candidatus Kapabacteria bacterium]